MVGQSPELGHSRSANFSLITSSDNFTGVSMHPNWSVPYPGKRLGSLPPQRGSVRIIDTVRIDEHRSDDCG